VKGFCERVLDTRDFVAAPEAINARRLNPAHRTADFLDTYYANYVEAEGLRDPATIRGRLKAIKAVLGDQPVTVLEKPAEVLRFKAAYRKGREVATVNRALSTLRAVSQ
jgi:hypothetical protein